MSVCPDESIKKTLEPQCQFFVLRKKRLCRMTVKPGRQYCGEHDPKTNDEQADTRMPCPNDPKHTCYVSKLEKHLAICNARPTDQPSYIVHNINAPTEIDTCQRKPLSEISKTTLLQVIDKVNLLYDKHIKDNIVTASERPIHPAVAEEFSQSDRTESSLRHLRQTSRLLWLVEEEGLVEDKTCYAELGAGKGQLSYFACTAWCDHARGSTALLVDRASLRHKRDNKLRAAVRVRADLAHLALPRVPAAANAHAVVGLAKHLCGVATDYALRCLTCGGAASRTRGAVLATCCHHRCERAAYVAGAQLQDLGINGEEFNVMLGIVSWATCGDGRSRDKKNPAKDQEDSEKGPIDSRVSNDQTGLKDYTTKDLEDDGKDPRDSSVSNDQTGLKDERLDEVLSNKVEHRNENVLTKTEINEESKSSYKKNDQDIAENEKEHTIKRYAENTENITTEKQEINANDRQIDQSIDQSGNDKDHRMQDNNMVEREIGSDQTEERGPIDCDSGLNSRLVLSQQYREQVGRKAKALLDWGRVLYLRGLGFEARLCYYVPHSVSLENVCIVAKKKSPS